MIILFMIPTKSCHLSMALDKFLSTYRAFVTKKKSRLQTIFNRKCGINTISCIEDVETGLNETKIQNIANEGGGLESILIPNTSDKIHLPKSSARRNGGTPPNSTI